MMAQISNIPSSKTPCVEGYVTINAAKVSEYFSALCLKSSKSTLPLSSHLTTTTCIPHIDAEAGFVPCAELGIRQISLCASDLLR